MGQLRKIAGDFFGLWRVCGVVVALRWLWQVLLHAKTILRSRSLQPADLAAGEGPFLAHYRPGVSARMSGTQAISGLREIWIRDVYLSHGFLKIPPDAMVVDLGANMGNFTMLALAHGPGVRTISVEPMQSLREKLIKQLQTNGWSDRTKICPNFVGASTSAQQELQKLPDAQGAKFLSEAEFIEQYGIQRIDFLKCDIEGSEFGLLTRDSRLLAMARQVAIELHAWGGDVPGFVAMLKEMGFETKSSEFNGMDMIVSARRATVPGANPAV